MGIAVAYEIWLPFLKIDSSCKLSFSFLQEVVFLSSLLPCSPISLPERFGPMEESDAIAENHPSRDL